MKQDMTRRVMGSQGVQAKRPPMTLCVIPPLGLAYRSSTWPVFRNATRHIAIQGTYRIPLCKHLEFIVDGLFERERREAVMRA